MLLFFVLVLVSNQVKLNQSQTNLIDLICFDISIIFSFTSQIFTQNIELEKQATAHNEFTRIFTSINCKCAAHIQIEQGFITKNLRYV